MQKGARALKKMKEKGREIRSLVRHINCKAGAGKKNCFTFVFHAPRFRRPLRPLRSIALKIGSDPHPVHVLSFSLTLVCV